MTAASSRIPIDRPVAARMNENSPICASDAAMVSAVLAGYPSTVTMLIAMAPLVVLFELSVVLARIFERRRAAAEPGERWDLDDDLSLS